MCFLVKRIYQPPGPDDGYRLLVDRLWPRGISKERASLDAWMKEVGPSSELRRWFNHDAARWTEFKWRYGAELDGRPGLVGEIIARAAEGPVTLLYSARDPDHNQAVALAEYLTFLMPFCAIKDPCQSRKCAACIGTIEHRYWTAAGSPPTIKLLKPDTIVGGN